MSAEIEAALIELIEERDEAILRAERTGEPPAPLAPRAFAQQLIDRVDGVRERMFGENGVKLASRHAARDEAVLAALIGLDVATLHEITDVTDSAAHEVAESLKYLEVTGFVERLPGVTPQPQRYRISERWAEAHAQEERTEILPAPHSNPHAAYPRLVRTDDGCPVWDQGPLGMSVALSSMRMPPVWPEDWPEPPLSDGVATQLLAEWEAGLS